MIIQVLSRMVPQQAKDATINTIHPMAMSSVAGE
jgi:hypothetical protein